MAFNKKRADDRKDLCPFAWSHSPDTDAQIWHLRMPSECLVFPPGVDQWGRWWRVCWPFKGGWNLLSFACWFICYAWNCTVANSDILKKHFSLLETKACWCLWIHNAAGFCHLHRLYQQRAGAICQIRWDSGSACCCIDSSWFSGKNRMKLDNKIMLYNIANQYHVQ